VYNLENIGKLHLELTSRCNASCPSCSRNFSGAVTHPDLEITELSINDIKNFFPTEFARNIMGINYCGNLGDPGIALDLLPILEYFQITSKRHIVQQVRTNGGMRKPTYWKEVGNFFFQVQKNRTHTHDLWQRSSVVFSVDGLKDTNHIYRRGVHWEKVIANMEAYASTGATGIWEFLVFEHNQHQVSEAKKIADDLGFSLVLKNPMGFGEYNGKQIPIWVYNKDGEFEYPIYPVNFQGERVVKENVKNISFKIPINPEPPTLNDFSSNLGKTSCIKCRSVDNSIQEVYVSATGHLLPCCFLGGVFGQFYSTYSRWQFNHKIKEMGIDKIDLRKNNIYEILNNSDFKSFFIDGWNKKSVEDGRLLFCVEMCGSISAINNLYYSRDV
jgi:hypothetical protein